MPKAKPLTADEVRRRCQHDCKARCCRYLTIQIPAPRLKRDFDELSWFLAHENVSVYIECRRWHVEVQNRCKHLTQDNLCDDYENRPDVCRTYSGDVCEYPERPLHDTQFDSQEEFNAWWARRRERERRKRRARARKRRDPKGRRA
jgi:Fe-S-cluster containining protein